MAELIELLILFMLSMLTWVIENPWLFVGILYVLSMGSRLKHVDNNVKDLKEEIRGLQKQLRYVDKID